MTPKLTVLMAVHNGEQWLAEAVESILRQTWEDFELVVVDDGSRDRSAEIVASLDDHRIRLLRNAERAGLAASLNLGLAAARGALIARHDADDVSDPTRLERQVQFLHAHRQVALAGTWYRRIDASGRVLAIRHLPCDATRLRMALLFYCPFVHTSIAMRASIVREVGGYDGTIRYGEDYELWSRIAWRAPVANVPEVLVGAREHVTSMTSTMKDEADAELPEIGARNVHWVLTHGGVGTADIDDARRLWRTLVQPSESDVSRRDGRGEVRSRAADLLDAFGRAYRLERGELAAARRMLHQILWRRRVEQAERRADAGDGAAAWRMLSAAIALHPAGAVHARSLRLLRRRAGIALRALVNARR